MICGTPNIACNPPYPVEYHGGVVIQYFGDDQPDGTICTDNLGTTVPCTRNCEVLGIGTPHMTLIDPSDSFGGINITHYSVPSLTQDPFQCPFDPSVCGTSALARVHATACRLPVPHPATPRARARRRPEHPRSAPSRSRSAATMPRRCSPSLTLLVRLRCAPLASLSSSRTRACPGRVAAVCCLCRGGRHVPVPNQDAVLLRLRVRAILRSAKLRVGCVALCRH